MSYLLDTNSWIVYLNQRNAPLVRRIEGMRANALHLCSIVKAELFYGAYKSPRRDKNLKLLGQLFSRFDSYSFDDLAAEVCGQIRAELEVQGKPIGPNDVMIAAIARSRDLTLVTHNVSEFSRVPGLKMEDWQS